MEKEVHMKFDSLEAIVNFAIEKEKEAVEFYSNLSKEEAFSGTKEMLRILPRKNTSTRKCSRSSGSRA